MFDWRSSLTRRCYTDPSSTPADPAGVRPASPPGNGFLALFCFACSSAAPLQAAYKNCPARVPPSARASGERRETPSPSPTRRQRRPAGRARRADTLILTCREPRDFTIAWQAFTSAAIRRTSSRRAETVTGGDGATVAPPFRRRPPTEARPAPPAARTELIRTSVMPRIDAEL